MPIDEAQYRDTEDGSPFFVDDTVEDNDEEEQAEDAERVDDEDVVLEYPSDEHREHLRHEELEREAEMLEERQREAAEAED